MGLFKDNKLIGFCTIRYEENAQAQLGLIGITTQHQGKGYGKSLIQKVLNYLFEKKLTQVTTVTQGRNYAAQRIFQQAGFTTLTTQLWYHKWLY